MVDKFIPTILLNTVRLVLQGSKREKYTAPNSVQNISIDHLGLQIIQS